MYILSEGLTERPDAPNAVEADSDGDEKIQDLGRRPVACQEEHEHGEGQRHQLEHVVVPAAIPTTSTLSGANVCQRDDSKNSLYSHTTMKTLALRFSNGTV